ncbi:putative DNA repair protein Rev1 [Plasmopara halstedii]
MRRRGDGVDSGTGSKRLGEHHDGSFGTYMSHKIQKLRGQNERLASSGASTSSSKQTDIFRDVHVYVDGYTVPSKEDIRQLMLLHGGGFEHYDTNRVTHVIATHLPASKLRQLQKAKKPLPVVHPDWILQSIEQKKLLPVHVHTFTASNDQTISPANEINHDASQHSIDDESDVSIHQPSRTINLSDSGVKSRTNSTRDGPDFVRHFFAKSRLHHIGTWKATFQQQAASFQAKYKGERITRAPLLSNDRIILHVDMDCFFVAVAQRGRPELNNVPVAVAHSETAGSSEISSCNYLARAKGVCAGMYMHTAKEKCPDLIVLPYEFDAIQCVSFQIYNIFFSHTPYVQAVSCDEAFLEFGSETNGLEKAETIRKEIFEQTECIASVGVSYNVLLAKLSSKKAKPNGIFRILDSNQAQELVLSLKVGDLPGVGRKTNAKLEALGVDTVTHLAQMTKSQLVQSLGKASGEMLYDFARGIDLRPVSMESNSMRKSVSAVVNFGIRFEKWQDATTFLMSLGEELSYRLRSLRVRTQCLTLLIKKRSEGAPIEPSKFMGHGICDNFSKSHVLAQATDDQVVIGKICIELLREFNFPCEELRGVGVQATKLISDAPSSKQQGGQLIKAWLDDSAQRPANYASSNSAPTMTGRLSGFSTEENANRNTTTDELAVTTFSQIEKEVLDELPESVQHEILASYGRCAPSNATHQARVKRPANGKAPLRRRHPARNIFSSKSNNQLARCARYSGGEDKGKEDALDDIRMSQIDSEVYHSLPLTIRREIDRYAKKRRPTSTVAPLPRTDVVSNSSPIE